MAGVVSLSVCYTRDKTDFGEDSSVCVFLRNRKGTMKKTYTFEGFFRYLGNTGSV